MAKKKGSTPGEDLAKQIIEQYNPKSVADMQPQFKLLKVYIEFQFKAIVFIYIHTVDNHACNHFLDLLGTFIEDL